MTRLLRALRPAEWAVVGFIGLAVARLWWRGGLGALSGGGTDLRSRELFVVLCIVGAGVLGRDSLRVKAPVPETLRGPLLLGLVVCALPAPLALWVRVNDPIWSRWSSFDFSDRLFQLGLLFVLVAGAAAPTMALWFFVAREVRARPGVRAGQLVRDGLRGLAASLREWWPLLTMISSYWLMDGIIGQPANGGFDETMRSIDRVLGFGHEPVRVLERVINVPLSEWCAFSYTFYAFEYAVCIGAVYAAGGHLALREIVTALTIGLGLTFLSYTLVPVKGPVLAMTFEVPLELYLNSATKDALMDQTRIIWDCFPSFHTAGSMLMSWACFRHARRVFWLTLPMILTTPFACVYLRYHYAIDVLAGAALAGALMWLTPKLLAAYRAEPGP